VEEVNRPPEDSKDARSAATPRPMNRRARVAIVEDNVALREQLLEIITADGSFDVSGAAASLAAGLQLLEDPPDVLLVDLGLPDGDGVELIRAVHARSLDCRCLVVSVFTHVPTVMRAIEAGADGYILKASDDPGQVLEAVRTVLVGGAPISPLIARHILEQVRLPVPGLKRAGVALTPRELQTLEGLAQGLSYKEVAHRHGVSSHTVAEHVKCIYKKLGVNSRGEAVFAAVSSGLLRLRH
jgi:DNA-binding NarL/FixJ family response regulator